MKLYKSKDYENFVVTKICESIAEKNGVTKEKARLLFFNALAYNTVVEEILNRTVELAAQEESAA